MTLHNQNSLHFSLLQSTVLEETWECALCATRCGYPVRLLCHSQFNNDNNVRILKFSCPPAWMSNVSAPKVPLFPARGRAFPSLALCGIKTIISLCNKVNCVRNACWWYVFYLFIFLCATFYYYGLNLLSAFNALCLFSHRVPNGGAPAAGPPTINAFNINKSLAKVN